MKLTDIAANGRLTHKESSILLSPHKTIREPIHGDILVNRLEVPVIDTREFQRLRHHKQLGLSYLVYPGAEHSRFQHALGTLHIANHMLETVNKNAVRYPDPPGLMVDDYGRLLTRMTALLHDMVNIPFGHTLEDEGLLVEKDWKDTFRVNALFRNDGFLERTLAETMFSELGLEEKNSAIDKARLFLQDLRNVLTFNESEHSGFEYAYSADIVGNTFCADLLDYLERDTYFTGIQGKFQADRSRAISYLFIPAVGEAKHRLVVRLWHHDRFKDDVVSELFSVLRARKDLAEAVYFHHSKVCASAMLIAAVQRSNLISTLKSLETPSLLELTDYDIFALLKSDKGTQFSKSIISDLECRRLYVPVYLVSRLTTPQPEEGALEFQDLAERKLRDPDHGAEVRLGIENELADLCGLSPGQVIVYCPDTDMSLKAAKARVLWENKAVAVLEDIKANEISERIGTLKTEHQALWDFYVFTDSRTNDEQRRLLAAACYDRFKRKNEVVQYRDTKNARSLSIESWAYDRNVPPREMERVKDVLLETQTRDTKRTRFLQEIGYSDRRLPSREICDKVWDYERQKSSGSR